MQLLKNLRRKIPDEVFYIFSLFLITRTALEFIGVFSRASIGRLFGRVFSSNVLLDIWGQWDTEWYMNIAGKGYPSPLTAGQTAWGFFPLYPWLSRAASFITGNAFTGGLIVSNICFLVACYLLFQLVQHDFSKEHAEKTLLILFLFPTAYLFSGMLSESLYFLLAVGCFLSARKEKWLAAGLLGFFLAMTRALGVFVIIPLLVEYLHQRNWSLRKVQPNIVSLGFIPSGLGVFLLLGYVKTGNFFAYSFAQSTGWGSRWTNPIVTMSHALTNIDPSFVVNSSVSLCVIAFLTISAKTLRPSYWVFALYSILIPVSTGLDRYHALLRYLVVIFPLYIVLATYVKNRSLQSDAILITFAMLQGFFMAYWAIGFRMVV